MSKNFRGLGKNDKGINYFPDISSSRINSSTIITDRLIIKGVDLTDTFQGGSISFSGISISNSTLNNTTIGTVTPAFGRFTTIDIINTTASISSVTGSITTVGGIGISNSTDASSFTNGGSGPAS